ncbi:uncharacterized protein LOC104891897 [Beta vulgaris subsp. vulgaris]|uniref:uncharacterized protein LOC104891897 n=1 Tax=Beta vulgaris subsp. vulgaris TaxID=3555 RepID=UPI002036CAF2|nr:uncharacterized protein LOC104891897 [Beta vulgaris subsp. vulgaris]
MSLKPMEEKNEEEYTITEEREELMIPPSSDTKPTLRKSHFLKPLINPINQSLPKISHLSLSSPNNINKLLKIVNFKGRPKPLKAWETWVKDLQQTHEIIWKKVGIFHAIKASIYKIKRDNELIMCLAEKWCPETNTFVFPWGESTISLEDVMVLGGYSVLGNSVVNTFNNSKSAKIKEKLVKSCYVIKKKNRSKQLSHCGWMYYHKGRGGEMEHVALLVLWLTRYVLSTNLYITPNVFDIAISLVLGTKIALAPAVLAPIYRDLTLLKEYITSYNEKDGYAYGDDGSYLVLCAPFQLLQLWAWERFPASSPKPATLMCGEPRAARWHNVMKLKSASLRLDIESAADSFLWRPYTLCLKNWEFPKFYCDDERWVLMNSEVGDDLLSFVRCLRVSELVGLDCVMQYLPHRVGMQFGMDQDIPDFVARSNSNVELAWSSYAKPLEGMKLYLPPRLFEGDVTVQYSTWWRSPMLALENDTLITYKRRKRSSRKVRTLSRIIKGPFGLSFEGMASPNPLNIVNDMDSDAGLNPLNEQEDGRMYASIASEEVEGKKVMIIDGGSKHSEATHIGQETERLCSVLAEDNHVSEDEIEVVMKHECNAPVDVEDENDVNGHDRITDGGNKRFEATHVGRGTKKLCSLEAEDNHLGEDAMEAVMKHEYTAPIDVEDEKDDLKQLEARGLVLESRISKLERLVARYKVAKLKSKV